MSPLRLVFDDPSLSSIQHPALHYICHSDTLSVFSPHYDIQFMRRPCLDRRCIDDVHLYHFIWTDHGRCMRWTILTYLSPVRGSIEVIRWSVMPYGNPDSLHKANFSFMALGKGTSRQRSGKGAIRKRFPLQKPRWEKTKLTIRYLYHETYRKLNEQLFSQ